MISYHTLLGGAPAAYSQGFLVADTNDVSRLARGITRYVWSPCVWKDGKRCQENFLRADWAVLDFDSGEMTLEEACRIFCDTIHLIGTTKSHQIAKDGKPACDRFRVVLKLERTTTDLGEYRATMASLVTRYPADPAPKDGARFFFPCREIASSLDEGYTEQLVMPTESPLTPEQEAIKRSVRRLRYERLGKLPGWVSAFLKQGRLVRGGGRNNTVYAVVRELSDLGFEEEEIRKLVDSAPIDRKGLKLDATIKSGMKGGSK